MFCKFLYSVIEEEKFWLVLGEYGIFGNNKNEWIKNDIKINPIPTKIHKRKGWNAGSISMYILLIFSDRLLLITIVSSKISEISTKKSRFL